MGRPLTTAETMRLLSRLPGERPFIAHEADRLGVNNHQRRLLVARGLLVRPVRGVFHRAGLENGLELRLAILRLVVPGDCVVTDRTAAWLWGAQLALAPNDHLRVPPVSVFAPPGRRLKNGLTASGERGLGRRDVVNIDGVLITSQLRTACDLGRLLHRDQALASMDMLAALRRFTVEQLVQEMARFKGYRGVIQARVLAPLVDRRSQSPMESITRLRWYDAGLPRPECQVEIPGPHGSYFIDIGLPEERFGAEYFGEEFHGHDEQEHDETRLEWARRTQRWSIVVARKQNVLGRTQDLEETLHREWRTHCALTRPL